MKKIIPLMVLLLMACGSTPAHQATSDSSSIEEEAVDHLYDVLNSGKGHMMSASELAHQDRYEYNSYFMVDIPITDANEQPVYDVPYVNEETGGTIVFHQKSIEGDTICPIGTADLCTVVHEWKTKPDTTITYRVHARGSGLYTFYNIRHKGCHCIHHDRHPDGFPEYTSCIVWIKPGSKELLITWGYKRSERIYHAE